MRDRWRVGVVTIAWTAAMCVVSLPFAVEAQAPFAAPRNEWGQPDLQGIWQVLDPSAHYDLEPHSASYGVPAGAGVVIDPADGMIPYTAAGLARRAANRDARATADPYGRCYKAGTPHLMYSPFPFQIVQSRGFLTIMSEYVHGTRFIFLNRTDHFGEGEIDLWYGDSVGRWDGDTLVTDVFNVHPDVWLDRAGNHAGGPQLRISERFTLIDADTIRYRTTLTDPEDFARPWTLQVLLYRHKDPNKRILEYECHSYADNAQGEPVLPVVP